MNKINLKELYDEVFEINGGEIIRFKCKFRTLRLNYDENLEEICSIKPEWCPLVKNKLIGNTGETSIMEAYGCNGWIALEWTDYIKYRSL